MIGAMKGGTNESKESLFEGEEKEYTRDGDIAITRKQTTIEREVRNRLDSAHALSTGLISSEDLAKHEVEQYMPPVSIHIDFEVIHPPFTLLYVENSPIFISPVTGRGSSP